MQIILPHAGTAQTRAKKVMGSFIFNHKSYDYEFHKNDANNYSFKISDITKESVQAKPDAPKTDAKGQSATTPSSPGNTTDPAKTDTKVQSTTTGTTASTADPNNTTGGTQTTNGGQKATAVTVSGEEVKAFELVSFDDFSRDKFINLFKDQINAFDSTQADLDKKALEVFFTINANLDFLDDEPVTAHLILKKDNISSFLISNTSPYYDESLSEIRAFHKIQDVQVETDDGAIKNIIVYLIKDTEKKADSRGSLEFKNAYPISISGKHDPERLSQIKLNCFDCGGIQGLNRYIKLSDLLQLNITLENDKDDYSPANATFNINPQKPIVELRKEKRSQIISVSAFSDFIGIDQEEPNGLIQIEAKRKVNINTNYKPFKKFDKGTDIASKYNLSAYDFIRIHSDQHGGKIDDTIKYYVIKKGTRKAVEDKINSRSPLVEGRDYITIDKFENRKFKPGYRVWAPSIEPKLLFAKLDDKNRFVLLDEAQSTGGYVNPLKQFQHQLVSFGTTISVLKLVYPQSKLTWNFLDIGAFWYRTRVQNIKDTATNNSVAINNGFLSATTSIVFKPDSRWSFSNALSYYKQQSFNSTYGFEHNTGLFQYGFDGTFKTNETSKIFARFRWTFSEHTFKQNFTQLQIGYSVNLFANASSSK